MYLKGLLKWHVKIDHFYINSLWLQGKAGGFQEQQGTKKKLLRIWCTSRYDRKIKPSLWSRRMKIWLAEENKVHILTHCLQMDLRHMEQFYTYIFEDLQISQRKMLSCIRNHPSSQILTFPMQQRDLTMPSMGQPCQNATTIAEKLKISGAPYQM